MPFLEKFQARIYRKKLYYHWIEQLLYRILTIRKKSIIKFLVQFYAHEIVLSDKFNEWKTFSKSMSFSRSNFFFASAFSNDFLVVRFLPFCCFELGIGGRFVELLFLEFPKTFIASFSNFKAQIDKFVNWIELLIKIWLEKYSQKKLSLQEECQSQAFLEKDQKLNNRNYKIFCL